MTSSRLIEKNSRTGRGREERAVVTSGAAGDEAEQQASRGDDARGEMAASPLFGGERRGEGGAEEI